MENRDKIIFEDPEDFEDHEEIEVDLENASEIFL